MDSGIKPRLERLRARVVVFVHDVLRIPASREPAYWLRVNLGNASSEFMVAAL